MTMCWMYAADMKGVPWSDDLRSHPPRRLTEDFPWIPNGHYNAHFHEWVKAAGIEVREVAIECFVARVTKAQVLAFIEYCYGSEPSYNNPAQMLRSKGRPYLVVKLEKLKAQVPALDERGEYGIVAATY
jgi:hypothetical protein